MDFTDAFFGDLASMCDEWEELAVIVIDGVKYVPAEEALAISVEASLSFLLRLLTLSIRASILVCFVLLMLHLILSFLNPLADYLAERFLHKFFPKKKQAKQTRDPQP